MANTAENLAVRYQISRDDVDLYAERSFAAAQAAKADGYFDDEIMPVRIRIPR